MFATGRRAWYSFTALTALGLLCVLLLISCDDPGRGRQQQERVDYEVNAPGMWVLPDPLRRGIRPHGTDASRRKTADRKGQNPATGRRK